MTFRFLKLSLPSLVAALAACGGGGGGGSGGSPASVSSTATTVPAYSQVMLITVNGANLDTGVTVSSAGCSSLSLSTTAPNVSTPSIAYWRCTVSAVGAQQASVIRSSDNTVLATVDFNVPVPQVTLTVSNGAAVDGSLVLTLAPQQAPITVNNFLAYVNAGFYDDTVFHRLSPGFVLQGGGFASGLNPANPVPALKLTNPEIALEVGRGLSNLRLSVAMARTNQPNSATSQFFINLVDNVGLDTANGGYAVFGGITTGEAFLATMIGAPCVGYPALLGGGECLPFPNLVIVTARQTR